MPADIPRPRVLLASARFYPDIADALVAGARAALDDAGAQVETAEVPGAFELPAAIALAADSGAYDAYVALGCVIRGETTHYDYVCRENAHGLARLSIDRRLAIGYGVLTVETREQAWERAATDRGDKGGAAARACLDMLALRRRFGEAR